MPPIKWPRMTLLGRIALFLAVFGAAIALQIGIGYYQSKYVLEPLERRSESIQTISRFLNDVESCMTALENYRWDYGDAAALIASIQSSREHSAGHLALIRADLGAVSEEQYLLASAARTTYGTLDLTLGAITEELRSGRTRPPGCTMAARSPAAPICGSTPSSFWSRPARTARRPTSASPSSMRR